MKIPRRQFLVLATLMAAVTVYLRLAFAFIRTGKLRALAVTGATPADVLPGLPPIGKFLPSFEATAWDGTCAPKTTLATIVDKLNAAINAGLADPQFEAKIKDLGGGTMPMTPEQFGETAKWDKMVKFSGAKAK